MEAVVELHIHELEVNHLVCSEGRIKSSNAVSEDGAAFVKTIGPDDDNIALLGNGHARPGARHTFWNELVAGSPGNWPRGAGLKLTDVVPKPRIAYRATAVDLNDEPVGMQGHGRLGSAVERRNTAPVDCGLGGVVCWLSICGGSLGGGGLCGG